MERADVVLVYPQRAPAQGRHWIMPSLGLMYLSASLRRAGYSVKHIDHTFLERREDLVAVGEGEETIVSIMEHLADRSFDEIPGVVFKRDGEVVRSTARQRTKEMSHLPLPYRGDIPNDEYIAYWRKHWKDATTPLMSTRGCPFRCDFCHKS